MCPAKHTSKKDDHSEAAADTAAIEIGAVAAATAVEETDVAAAVMVAAETEDIRFV